MSVDYIKPELQQMLDVYQLTSDCYMGEKAVKRVSVYTSQSHGNGAGASNSYGYSPYLPDPSPVTEDPKIAQDRYQKYLQRAVFYNVTRRTVKAMVGAIFAKYPNLTLDNLEVLESDIDGGGQSLMQQAKRATVEVFLKGRAGLLADMPVNEHGVTKAEMTERSIKPTVKLYKPESIINWRTKTIGGVTKLSLVVLSENYVKSDDGFEQEVGKQLLVLRLNDNNLAESEIYQNHDSGWISQGVNQLRDSSGKQLNEIPFYFIGADDNDSEIDDSPIYDIAQLNIAHFRDSAELQETAYISGQPTLILSGLTQVWVDDNLSDGVSIGSRSGILLPEGSNASLLQASVNDINFKNMQHKEEQMTALGAKLIEPSSSNKTATQASQDNAEESSVLATISYNVSDAYTKAIKACARFMGVDDSNLIVTFNSNFSFNKMTPEQRQMLMAEWQAGGITWKEYRNALVEDEIAIEEDEKKAKSEIEQEQGAMLHNDRLDDE